MRGVVIREVEDGLLQRGRVYLEPVATVGGLTWEEFYTAEGDADGR